MSKYGAFSGPYFPVFGKYGPEKLPYLDTFYAVSNVLVNVLEELIVVGMHIFQECKLSSGFSENRKNIKVEKSWQLLGP